MAVSANVSSIDAIERFRSALIVYVEKARATVDDVSDDVQKTKHWLEGEQTRHWQQEIRRRTRKFEEAQQELFTARLSGFKEDTQLQQMMVNRTKRELVAAEEKLKTIRRWVRDFDSVVTPVAKQMEKIDSVLSGRMPKANSYLTEIIKALESYASVRQPLGTNSSVATAAATDAETPVPDDSAVENPEPEAE
jgi:hypothetical protein